MLSYKTISYELNSTKHAIRLSPTNLIDATDHIIIKHCLQAHKNTTKLNTFSTDNVITNIKVTNSSDISTYSSENHIHDSTETIIVPDKQIYEYGIINLTIHIPKKYNGYYNSTTKQQQNIVKIIKNDKENNRCLIKLVKTNILNWGYGMTCLPTYVMLNTKDKLIDTICVYNDKVGFEERVLNNSFKLYDIKQEYFNRSYNTIAPSECCVCLDKMANIFCHCKTFHLACCSECIKELDKCPICKETIITFDKVGFL